MAHIEGATNIVSARFQMEKQPSHTRHSQLQNEGVLQPSFGELVRPRSRERAKGNENRFSVNGLDLDSRVLPNAVESGSLFMDDPAAMTDLTSVEKSGMPADSSRKLNTVFPKC